MWRPPNQPVKKNPWNMREGKLLAKIKPLYREIKLEREAFIEVRVFYAYEFQLFKVIT